MKDDNKDLVKLATFRIAAHVEHESNQAIVAKMEGETIDDVLPLFFDRAAKAYNVERESIVIDDVMADLSS
jgi:hypothetical protein